MRPSSTAVMVTGKDGLKGCASWLLREHTKAFVPLLVRLLPLQVSAQVTKHSKLTVNILPIPRGHFYNAEGELRPGPSTRVIDHIADEVAAITIDDIPAQTDNGDETSAV